MNITCNMADDLLPLYVDESCSLDSRNAIEAHLAQCSKCKDKLDRMQRTSIFSDTPESIVQSPDILAYGKKIHRRRIAVTVTVCIAVFAAAVLLSLVLQTLMLVSGQKAYASSYVPSGVTTLTSGDLTCSADEIREHTLFTNTTRIVVTVSSPEAFNGTVRLWNVDYTDECIMLCDVDSKNNVCVFTNLSSEYNYSVSLDNVPNASVTVSEKLHFWDAFLLLIQNKL